MDPLMTRQLALEEEMRTTGIDRYRREAVEANAENHSTERRSVYRLMEGCHLRVVAAIHHFRAEMASGKAGRRGAAAAAFEKVNDNDLLAHMALRIVLDSINSKPPLTRTAINLGSLIDDELLFRAFKRQDSFGYKNTVRKLKVKNNEKFRRGSGKGSARAAGIVHEGWDQRTMLQVGLKLIELVVDHTNLVELVRDGRYGAKSPQHIVATDQTLEWLASADSALEWRFPLYMPTIVPPKPWSGLRKGGYLGDRVRLTLTKSRDQSHLKGADLSQVYSALNAIQETPWAINTRVLEVMQALWDAGSDSKVIPQVQDEPLPERLAWFPADRRVRIKGNPDFTANQQADFLDWANRREKVADSNVRSRSRRVSFRSMMMVADRFKAEDAIYFPHQLDFRGRVYPVPLYLTPQGDDAQRGLLQFANSVPIKDEDAARWLAIHGAGLWGVDKVNFDERVNWVVDNEAAILAVANDPLGQASSFWMDADGGEKAWQALAFCFDWAGFVNQGYGYESRLPVQMDGSCNGLQNFSAILRDPVGGAAVNLVPADKPSDIYSEVARLVEQRVVADAKLDTPEGQIARGWVGRIDRKVCKIPVMTLAYGASRYGFRDMVMQDTVKPWRQEHPETFPWEGSGFHAALYLGAVIWDCVGEVVVAARAAMDWLQDVAKRLNKAGKAITWRTPSGFVVRQGYMEQTTIKVTAIFRSSFLQVYLNEDSDRLDHRRQISGLSPNWVHSLDAAHLTRTVNAAHALGLRSYSMIHDSYGTHAGNANALALVLREEFVRMYSERNWLDAFAEDLAFEGLDLPPIPPSGGLDLQAVLESPFFFA